MIQKFHLICNIGAPSGSISGWTFNILEFTFKLDNMVLQKNVTSSYNLTLMMLWSVQSIIPWHTEPLTLCARRFYTEISKSLLLENVWKKDLFRNTWLVLDILSAHHCLSKANSTNQTNEPYNIVGDQYQWSQLLNQMLAKASH